MFDHIREVLLEAHRRLLMQPRLYRACVVLAIVATTLVIWSCRGLFSPAGRLPVVGQVEFRGEPLAYGLISFHAADGGGDGPPVAGVPIRDGSYRMAAHVGLPPGRYVVRIRAMSGAAEWGPGAAVPPQDELIPPEFNDKSSLYVDVRPRWFGRNRFDFRVP